jgi:hypothetical protein
MAIHNVEYPKGFLDKRITIFSGRNYSKDHCDKYGSDKPDPTNILAETIPITIEELILNFNKIINTYKSNPTVYLELNNISKILTNEESVIKHALNKLDGTKGRCVISKKVTYISRSYEYISYNPILKETRKQLLILFNRFKKSNEADIIMYEGRQLFIQLFAIIIDSLDVPCPDGKKKDCTDIFPMITLLELLLNKKYKNILESSINNTPLPIPIPLSIPELKQVNNDEESGDDEWDKDDFEPIVSIPNTPSTPSSIIEAKINSSSKNDNALIEKTIDENKTKTKTDEKQSEEIPDDWDKL